MRAAWIFSNSFPCGGAGGASGPNEGDGRFASAKSVLKVDACAWTWSARPSRVMVFVILNVMIQLGQLSLVRWIWRFPVVLLYRDSFCFPL